MTLEAVVFDFDGTIVDTEWAIYELARTAFGSFDVELAEPDWATVIGLADEDGGWFPALCQRLGVDLARDRFEAAYTALDRSGRDHLPALPGVEDLTAALGDAGVPLAIASSSPLEWIVGHLTRLGLLDRFSAICGVDHPDVSAGKPAPDTYLAACAALGAEPARSVALEDSAPGVAAARAAGLVAVVVPNRLTRHVDLSGAHHRIADLSQLSVDAIRRLVVTPTRRAPPRT